MNANFWRRIPPRGLGVYFAGISVSVALMAGVGYSVREIVLAAESTNLAASSQPSKPASPPDPMTLVRPGRQLFLKNCAHCHGADGRGDEGPDLHNLDWTDEQIATRIRNGKKGQMTAFGGKFSPQDLSEVIAYLHTLK